MADEEWETYRASPRFEASGRKHYEWSDKEWKKIQAKIDAKCEAIEARYERDRKALRELEHNLRKDFQRRRLDHENRLVAADLKALRLKSECGK